MQKLIDEAVIILAENLQLPERVFNIEDLPWVPFDDGTCHFKPLEDLNKPTYAD